MRFSDWSSDVCSSDLSQSGALGIMNSISDVKADGGDLVVSLPEGNADLPLLLSDYHLVIQPNGGVDDPNAGIDRKSVVSGKSVSVRVDLGGGRLIKKNNYVLYYEK